MEVRISVLVRFSGSRDIENVQLRKKFGLGSNGRNRPIFHKISTPVFGLNLR